MSGTKNQGILIAPPFSRTAAAAPTPGSVHNQAMAQIERALATLSAVATSATAAIYAPLVNGDLPGPVAIADPFGQFIMTPIT